MGVHLLAPVLAREQEVRELLPVSEVLRLGAERTAAGEALRELAQRLRNVSIAIRIAFASPRS